MDVRASGDGRESVCMRFSSLFIASRKGGYNKPIKPSQRVSSLASCANLNNPEETIRLAFGSQQGREIRPNVVTAGETAQFKMRYEH